MRALMAPAPMSQHPNERIEVKVNESSFGSVIPQPRDIAKRAMSKISRRKNSWIAHYSAAHKQIVENEITDAAQIEMGKMIYPPRHVFTVIVSSDGKWTSALVGGSPERN